MGIFSRKLTPEQKRSFVESNPYIRARNEIWAEEAAALGEEEFQRRQQAVSDYQLGRTTENPFGDWNRAFRERIQQRAKALDRG